MNEILKKIEDTLDAKFSDESGRYSWNSDEDNSLEIGEAVEEILNDCGIVDYDVTSSDVFDCPPAFLVALALRLFTKVRCVTRFMTQFAKPKILFDFIIILCYNIYTKIRSD